MQSFRSPWYGFIPPAFVHEHRQQEEEQENRSHEPELQETLNYAYFHLRSSSFPVRRPPQFAQLIEPCNGDKQINSCQFSSSFLFCCYYLNATAILRAAMLSSRYIMDDHRLLPQLISGHKY
jgi:hypothetical protein